MSYKIKGDLEITRGTGLGVMTTAQRTTYTPAAAGYTVFDSTVGAEYSWDGAAWNVKAGLEARGTVTSDADAGEGIYNLDASGGAFNFTLPAATGSQKRRILLGEVFGNDVTVAVQTGETLNTTLNGTQIINTVGDVWYAIDRATGVWDLYKSNANGATIFDKVANITARDALTTMVTGDIVQVVEPPIKYRYDGSAWQLWDQYTAKLYVKSYVDADIPDDELNPFTTGPAASVTCTTAGQTRNVGYPSASFNQSDETYIEILNLVAGTTTVVFNPVYKDANGTDIGTKVFTSTGATENISYIFRRRTIAVAGSDEYWLVGGTEYSASSDAARTLETITQTAHGFVVTQPIYHNGTDWQPAQGDSASTVAQAIVTGVTDVNTFVITTHGTATVTGHGLTVGEYYWLDQATSAVTTIQPASGISQGLLHVRDVNTLFIDVEQAVTVSSSSTPAVDWTAYPTVFTGSTTSPILGTPLGTLRTHYKVVGKTLYVMFSMFRGPSVVGATSGTGRYRIALPAGYTVDTSIVTISDGSGFPNASTVGSVEFGGNNVTTNLYSGYVCVESTGTDLYVVVVNGANYREWGSSLGGVGSDVAVSFIAEIPIL